MTWFGFFGPSAFRILFWSWTVLIIFTLILSCLLFKLTRTLRNLKSQVTTHSYSKINSNTHIDIHVVKSHPKNCHNDSDSNSPFLNCRPVIYELFEFLPLDTIIACSSAKLPTLRKYLTCSHSYLLGIRILKTYFYKPLNGFNTRFNRCQNALGEFFVIKPPTSLFFLRIFYVSHVSCLS